ncbi:MFS transporter [Georgenia sp. AZ-5]|uniref:MFS transporter n=1 Tax=Georgenia sp. AZ-5 TaxID=3367526 RepID=UPI003754E5FB
MSDSRTVPADTSTEALGGPATETAATGPTAETAATGPTSTGGAGGLRARLLAGFGDPVLRILATATMVSTLGRGVFFTLTVLYFTTVVGLSAGQVAVVLSVASGVGVGTSLLGGQLADRLSARYLLVVLTVAEGVALVAYTAATSFAAVLALACVVTGAGSASHSVRSAIIARAFDGAARVGARAVLRTVTNVGIALGSAGGGLALLAGTGTAYRVTMVAAGVAYVLSALPLPRLPRRVDAPPRGAAPRRSGGRAAEAAAVPGRSPFRDARYLLLTVLSGAFSMQFALAEVGLPLWVSDHTVAPTVVVAIAFILNTVIVVAFQIRLSRGTDDVGHAGRVIALAGVLMLAATVAYAGSADVGAGAAVVLVLGAMTAHSFAEVLSSAGTWGLSFELAEPARAGAYQGLFAMGYNVGAMAAPVVVTATALTHGWWGWLALGVLFLVAALGMWWIARRATGPAAPAGRRPHRRERRRR